MPQQIEVKQQENRSKKVSVKGWIAYIILLILVGVFLPQMVSVTRISGHSMEPSFHDGDIVLDFKALKYFEKPKLGDVVILDQPSKGYRIIKRVYGVAGDTVEIKDGVTYINGEGIVDSTTQGVSEDVGPIKVPKGHIFVIGDNRNPGESEDSRDPLLGPIPLSDLEGFAVYKLSPFQKVAHPMALQE